MLDYDLEEQQQEEQFKVEEEEAPSKNINKFLREQRQYEKLNQKKESKHKAKFTRQNNQNCYVCDNCGKIYNEENGSLMYSSKGEFAYCKACLKELYPNYKHIKLATTIKKTELFSNHADVQYSKGFK